MQSSMAALHVVLDRQQLQDQRDLARLRKSMVFPRLVDIPRMEDNPDRPFSIYSEPSSDMACYNTIGMAIYHRAFHTTPEEALAFLRQKCISLDIPPPPHDWNGILRATSEMMVYDVGDHISEFTAHPSTDHHRLFLALGLLPHDQKHGMVSGTWRSLLWDWPLLTPQRLVGLANAVMPDGEQACGGEELEYVLELFDDEGGSVMIDVNTRLN
jgi:hypothetical protein